MFCVTTPRQRPAASSRANASWAGLGANGAAKNSRRISQERARTSAESTYRPKVKSIGSYRVHSPPGDRKSGIPDSVDTPAPVNPTTSREARSRSTRSGAGLTTAHATRRFGRWAARR